MDQTSGYSGSLAVTSVLQQSFVWMALGLLLTAVTAMFTASSDALTHLVTSLFFILVIAQLVLVFLLSLRVQRMSFGAALTSFVVYSFLNGLTLSSIFLLYTATSIATTFFTAAGVFGVMAVYGYTTKKDLTSFRSLFTMLLFGVIIGFFVNYFLRSSAFEYVLSFICIAVFVGLTAYDTQKLKRLGMAAGNTNLGIIGALILYLDFINLFLSILRFTGRRRN